MASLRSSGVGIIASFFIRGSNDLIQGPLGTLDPIRDIGKSVEDLTKTAHRIH